MTIKTAIRRPTGFLPLALSGAALALVLIRLTFIGAAPEMHAGRLDEGTSAHLWQIFMIGQLPMIAHFAIRWLRTDLLGTLSVLGFQLLAIVAAMAPVFLLGW